MVIYFQGISCPIKYYAIGVQGNNFVDKLEFVIKRYTNTGLDLLTYTPYIKLQNEKEQYFDKDGRVGIVAGDETITLKYCLRRKTTRYPSFDLQIQFESSTDIESDVAVWQTEAITFTLSRTIPADSAIENQYPTVLQDLSARVEKLEEINIINGGNP